MSKIPEWWKVPHRTLDAGERIIRGDWVCRNYMENPQTWSPVEDILVGHGAINPTFCNNLFQECPIYRRVLDNKEITE